MREYVLTIREDVCDANHKDVEATNLLETMKLWGDVKPLDTVLACVRTEYQGIIDNLTNKIDAISDQELTADELQLLNAYRACKKAEAAKYLERIDTLEKNIVDTRTTFKKKIAAFNEILNQED